MIKCILSLVLGDVLVSACLQKKETWASFKYAFLVEHEKVGKKVISQ
ncbi:hypothetical protein [Marinomonas sp. THO17]